MEKENKRHILLLYKTMIPSVRLCGHSQLEYLAAQGEVDYRPRTVMQVSKADMNWAEIVLLCRLDNTYELWLAETLKKANKTIVYVIDDNLLQVPKEMASGKYYAQPKVRSSIQKMIALSDAILSPSPVLLKKYAAEGQQGFLLEEPAIDPLPYALREAGKPVRIGFAGSVDRKDDIESILQTVLLRIHQERGDRVEFAFFGAVPAFAKDMGAQCIPYCDSYDDYRRTLHELQLDIGLAPMPDTPFHACKHYNKFVEYAAAGIVGIFSNVKPYDRLMDHFQWPLLCDNSAEAWYGMINDLLEKPERLEELKCRAAQLANNVFSVPVVARALLAEMEQLEVHPIQACEKVLGLSARKLLIQLRRIPSGAKRYGLKAVPILFSRIKNLHK